MKLKTKKIHNKNKRNNKKNTKKIKKNYKINSSIIHPASIILPSKYSINHNK